MRRLLKAPCAPFTVLLFFLSLLCHASPVVAGTPTASITTGPNMTTARSGHWLLQDSASNVIAVGGYDFAGNGLASVDAWSSTSNTFTGYSLITPALFSACAKLANGSYLLAGGVTSLAMANASSQAQIFNPETKSSIATAGAMNYARVNASAATLSNGSVLVVGSSGNNTSATYAEIYNPTTQTFTATNAVNTKRCAPIVLPTTDGKAVVLGGFGVFGGPVPESVELFDPTTNSFTVLSTTLFNGESGWITALSPGMGWGSQPVQAQRMANGKYLLFANKNTGIFTDYALFTFDPSTKAIEKISTSPVLPTRNPVDARYNVTVIPHPMINTSTNWAYMMAETFDTVYANSYAYSASSTGSSQIYFYGIDLSNNSVNVSPIQALETSHYIAMSAIIQVSKMNFFITGGGLYGYGKYAGGRPYGGYGYQHYDANNTYAQAATLFDTIDWHIFKGINSIMTLLMN